MMQAVILAAGKGTRMKELTRSTPKPLLRIEGRALLDIQLEHMQQAGIDKTTIVIGYLAEQIEEAFRSGKKGLSLNFVRQEVVDGTGSAVLLTRQATAHEPFLVTFSDVILFPEDYQRFIAMYAKCNCDALVGVNRVDDPWFGAAVVFDETGKVSSIIEKPQRGTIPSRWNNTGVLLFKPVIYDFLERLTPSPRGELELTAAIQMMIEEGYRVQACPLKGPVLHFSAPEDLAAGAAMLRSRKIS